MPETLDEWVTRRAHARPDAVAVVLDGERSTYGELEALSNRIARMLAEVGCRRGDRIGLLMPKSPTAVAAMLAIYKSDGVYVPFDPASPAARLARIVDACECRAVLAAGSGGAALAALLDGGRRAPAFRVGWLDGQPPGWLREIGGFRLDDVLGVPADPLERRNRSDDSAHILFTSGSTGDPKGVVITHANVIGFIEWAVRHFGIEAGDRLSGHAPLHFDLSFFDLFAAFAAGAELHLVPDKVGLFPRHLAAWMRDASLTQWFSVPSVLSYLARFDAVEHGDFPHLRRLLWCGEVLPTRSLRYWMQRLPHVRFTNLYGPTETTIASSYYTVPRCPENDRAPVPIGKACDGERLAILDEALRPVPPGEVGYLYIGGHGLSPGYWRDEAQTRRAFLPDPDGTGPSDRLYRTGDLARIGDDGLVYFLGRTDSQIKSRGYRIDLGEIEAALNAVGSLSECAVVALPSDGFEGTLIGCAYVVAAGATATPAELRRGLEEFLPRYMLPSNWMAFTELPKNANGKIDRRRLTETLQAHAVAAHQDA